MIWTTIFFLCVNHFFVYSTFCVLITFYYIVFSFFYCVLITENENEKNILCADNRLKKVCVFFTLFLCVNNILQ